MLSRQHQVLFFESSVWLDLGLNPVLPDHWRTVYSRPMSSSCRAASMDIPDSLATFPYRSSPLACLLGYIPYLHIAAVWIFLLVVLLFSRPYVGVHRSTSLMSSSLFLQQYPTCLVRLTWIVFVVGGRWLCQLVLCGVLLPGHVLFEKYDLMSYPVRGGVVGLNSHTHTLYIYIYIYIYTRDRERCA